VKEKQAAFTSGALAALKAEKDALLNALSLAKELEEQALKSWTTADSGAIPLTSKDEKEVMPTINLMLKAQRDAALGQVKELHERLARAAQEAKTSSHLAGYYRWHLKVTRTPFDNVLRVSLVSSLAR
jgi:hypothetical protein